MAVTITGAKYAARFLASVGTTSITTTQTIFASGDFGATQRMVALHSSVGAFKGIAWVRRWVSGTQLELENQFVDPATGLYVTQVVGDQVFVSKNALESAATGFAVDAVAMTVTVTDNIVMGTAGTQNSVCFYDQNYQFITINGFRFDGGVSVFGKLMSYDGTGLESMLWSRECDIRPRSNYPGTGGTPAYNIWGTGGTSAHMFFFGGAIGNSLRDSYFLGAQTTNATNGSFCFYGTRLYYACASPSNGGNWSANATRHLLYKTIHEADYSNGNLIVWGNGNFQGSFLSFPQYGAGTPLGIFRASSAVTFGASTNNRTIVNDLGTGAFIDDANNGSYTFINTITPAVSIVRFAGGNVPITMKFSDDYTNLKTRSTVAVVRGDGVLETSVVNTASTKFTATVTQATYSATANGNATPTASYSTFNYTVKCYGYGVVNGTHSTVTYPLGTAGNGTNLKLGGLINQVADTGVTLTETNALALSSKITINSTTKVITITANANLDEVYDYAVAWCCSSAANAQVPSLSQYLLTYTGTQLTAPTGWTLAVNNGITLSSGVKFNYIYAPTVTLTGTGKITADYASTAGTSTIWQFEGVQVGTSLAIYDNAGTTKYFQAQVTSAGSYAYYIAPGITGTYNVAVEKYPFKRETATFAANTGGILYFTPSYGEDVGITETTQSTVEAYTELETPSKVYDRTAVFRLTEQGIKIGQIFTRAGTNLEVQSGFSHVINKDATTVYGITGGVITTKSTSYAGDSKYTTEILVAPATLTANTTEIITIPYEDGGGNSSITIVGGRGTYEIWKIPSTTASADYETGTKIGDFTTANNLYRFIGDTTAGNDYLTVDLTTTVKDRYPATKGVYVHALYSGAEIQLAQAPEVIENGVKLSIIQQDLDDIKGAGFATSSQSLVKLKKHITGMNQA